jgi:hypothetical protein
VQNKLLVTLLIIILLVAIYLIGMGYLKQHRQQAALMSQISDVSQTLALMPEPSHDLESRLETAQADLTAERSAFLDEINSTQAINTILKLADSCRVKAIPLVTEPWSVVKVGEHDYSLFRLNVSVEGSFSELVSFMGKLENEEFETLIVENLSITRTAGQSVEGAVPDEDIHVTASLDLAIYTGPLARD